MLWTPLTGSPHFPSPEKLPGLRKRKGGVLCNNKGYPQAVVAVTCVNGDPFPLKRSQGGYAGVGRGLLGFRRCQER